MSAPGHKAADRWDFRCKAGKGRAMKEDTVLTAMAAAAAKDGYRIYF
ncbi:MAG: hypothetical protein H0V07_07870 [Propionibacteriales bacterium]|nr:hypothetical protein [Propionibacteriales bacterium]MBA3690618.1 hypothetical protein [Actinomycetota bacterium]